MQNNIYDIDLTIESDKVTNIFYEALTSAFYFINHDLFKFLPKDIFVSYDNFFKLYLPLEERTAKKGKNEAKPVIEKQYYSEWKLKKEDPNLLSQEERNKFKSFCAVEGEESLWKVEIEVSKSKYFTKNIPASIHWEVLLALFCKDIEKLFDKGDYTEKAVLDIGAFSKLVYLTANSFSYETFINNDVFTEYSEDMMKIQAEYKKALVDYILTKLSGIVALTANNKTEIAEKFAMFYYATLTYVTPLKHIIDETINYKMFLSVLCGQYLSNKHLLPHLDFSEFIAAVNKNVENINSRILNEKKEKKEKRTTAVKKVPAKKTAPKKIPPKKVAPKKAIKKVEEKEDFDLEAPTDNVDEDMII